MANEISGTTGAAWRRLRPLLLAMCGLPCLNFPGTEDSFAAPKHTRRLAPKAGM